MIYDSDNRLKRVALGGVTQTYLYDYEGNLVQKNVGGQLTRCVYAGGPEAESSTRFRASPAPVAEINVTANTEKDFIQANGRTWGVMEATKNTYFHHDAIGSVVALSNDNGEVTDTYEYEPFGKVLYHQGNSQNDYKFVGGYGVRKLNDTLDTMGVRQYSETVGRFTTQDPIGRKSGDLNFYRYANNNSLKYIDPKGLSCGSGWNECLVPDSPWGYVFGGACENHDKCYSTCGASKYQCDANFYADMSSICTNFYGGDGNCLAYARNYFYYVFTYGGSAYKNAQKDCSCKK